MVAFTINFFYSCHRFGCNSAEIQIKSSFYSRVLHCSKRVMSGGAHLRGLAPRALGDVMSGFTDPGIKPQIFTKNFLLNH